MNELDEFDLMIMSSKRVAEEMSNKKKSMYIAIDFDGTCVTHEFPEVGKEIGAARVIKRISDAGHKIIVYTMRDIKTIDDVMKWYDKHDIPIYSSNINPSQKFWTNSRKIYAHLYIDDAALGCPLIYDSTLSDRPFVDWIAVEQYLEARNII